MNYNLLRTGAASIILGPGHYGDFLPIKDNKLLKITKIIDNHNEFKHLDVIRSISNYKKYFTIPDEIEYLLNKNDDFYNKLEKLVKKDKMNIFTTSLECYYIDYAGNKDVHYTINEMYGHGDLSFWKSYKIILKFAKHIMEGLSFLHERAICHLDIKAENIMIMDNYSFKIIDFGFSSREPFDDYVFNIRGTPGYFPSYFNIEKLNPMFPRIEAIDLFKINNNNIPMVYDRTLVYKIDSYCLGRLLYCLKYLYSDTKTYYCYNNETRSQNKLTNLSNDLLNINPVLRITIKEGLTKYFS